MAEKFVGLLDIVNWPAYWPIIVLGVLMAIALLFYEIVDRLLAQRRGEPSHRLQWDDGYIERISKAFKNQETTRDQKRPRKEGTKNSFVKHTKTERMEAL